MWPALVVALVVQGGRVVSLAAGVEAHFERPVFTFRDLAPGLAPGTTWHQSHLLVPGRRLLAFYQHSKI